MWLLPLWDLLDDGSLFDTSVGFALPLLLATCEAFQYKCELHYFQFSGNFGMLEIPITPDMKMTPPLWQKVKRNYRASQWGWKRRVKADLKLNIQKTKIMVSSPFTSWQIDGEIMETLTDFTFLGSSITVDGDCSHEIKRRLFLDKSRQHIKKQRHYFADKGPYSQSYGFSSSHVCMWELDRKEGWALKNWCFWTVVLEKTLNSPLDCKEIKLVNS